MFIFRASEQKREVVPMELEGPDKKKNTRTDYVASEALLPP